MSHTINLNRKFMDVAAQFEALGKRELRAKQDPDGQMTLYAKKVSGAGRWFGDKFFNRKQKLADARQMVLQRFEVISQAEKSKKIVDNIFYVATPTTEAYRQAFKDADAKFSTVLALDDANFDAHYAQDLRDAAEKTHTTKTLEFILDVRAMSRLSDTEADRKVAHLAHSLFKGEHNVSATLLDDFAKTLGFLDKKAATKLTQEGWVKEIEKCPLSPGCFARLFKPFADELAADFQTSVYKPLL